MKHSESVLAVRIAAYKGDLEVATLHVAADSHATYVEVRNALFSIPGLTRVEISMATGGRMVTYVPEEGALLPVWRKQQNG